MEVDDAGWAVVCDACGGIGPVGQNEIDSVNQWNMRLALARNVAHTHDGVGT